MGACHFDTAVSNISRARFCFILGSNIFGKSLLMYAACNICTAKQSNIIVLVKLVANNTISVKSLNKIILAYKSANMVLKIKE